MGMVPPPLVRRQEETMGYQPLPLKKGQRVSPPGQDTCTGNEDSQPPKRQQRGKVQPKTDNPMDYYAENPVSRPATWTELLPTSEHTGWPYDPKLISGLSKKEQEQADHWFLGLADGPGGQSIEHAAKEEDPFALDPALLGENRIIPCGTGNDVTPEPTSIIRKHGGYSPCVQPDPEEVFPLRYRSPVVLLRDKRPRVADHLIINLM